MILTFRNQALFNSMAKSLKQKKAENMVYGLGAAVVI